MAFDTSILVEEKEAKGAKAIRYQKIGEKKEHFIRFEVSETFDLFILIFKEGGASKEGSEVFSVPPKLPMLGVCKGAFNICYHGHHNFAGNI